jgi:hypothetical protein
VLLLQGEVERLGDARQPIVAREKVVPQRIAAGLKEDTAGIPTEAAIVEIVTLITIEVPNITEMVQPTMALDHEVVRVAKAVRTLTAVPTARVVQTRTAVPMERVIPMPGVDRMDKVDFAVQARIVAGVARVGFEDGALVAPKAAVIAVERGAASEVLLVGRVRRGIALKLMRSQ